MADGSFCNAIGVDLEYHSVERHASILCLIQLSTVDKDYIVDSLVLREEIKASGLKAIFEDSGVVKVFHGSETDLLLLAADLGIVIVNLFDTARAFQYIQKTPKLLRDRLREEDSGSASSATTVNSNLISLEKLVKMFIDVELDKFFQVADWRLRPLPKGMLDYARCDSHYLIPIYAKF